jgi:hypothetical protein
MAAAAASNIHVGRVPRIRVATHITTEKTESPMKTRPAAIAAGMARK